jgi:hypothetical protein
VLATSKAAVEASSERRDMLGCKQILSIIVGFRVRAVALRNEVQILVRRPVMIPANSRRLPARIALTSLGLSALTVVNLAIGTLCPIGWRSRSLRRRRCAARRGDAGRISAAVLNERSISACCARSKRIVEGMARIAAPIDRRQIQNCQLSHRPHGARPLRRAFISVTYLGTFRPGAQSYAKTICDHQNRTGLASQWNS